MSETIDTSGVASKTEDNPQCQSSEPPQNFSDWTFGTRCLTLREQAIIQTIQNFTEEADWHIRVWDNAVVAEWYQRAASNPLITPKTWLWCIKELRDKAQVFEQDGYVWAIDSSSRVCKSDTCISSSVKNCLRDAISTLEKQHAVSPISGNMADIVDPAMYPLIRGQTRVARDTAISLNNVLESFGIGTPEPYEPADLPRHLLGEDEESNSWVGGMHQIEGGSSRLQWLPFEIEFTQKTGTDVKIVSYINNVHPDRDQGLYSAIEKLIPSVISSWNQVLVKDCRSRTPNRIGIMKLERDYEPILQTEDQDSVEIIDVNPPRPTAPVPELIVEPGEAFTFDEWKVGRKTAPMQNAGPVTRTLLSAELYPSLDHQFYSVEIENEFRDTGLQIILKLGGTGVLSSQPWSGGVTWEEDIWHFSGLPNERIVGTAMYFYDVQNIANPGIKFRQLSQMDKEMWYESALSASLKTLYQPDFAIGFIHPYLQDMGCVSIRENRLLTWPNTMEYKFNPFQLEDTTVPGRCSFATLYLVDPYNRICSTKHVPPQQHDWWMEQVLEAADFESKGLPQEIVDYIARYTDHWPIGIDEAKRLKDRMDDEHTDWHLSMSGRREGDMDATLEGHTGSTLMPDRSDALVTASRLITAVRNVARETGFGVATVGVIYSASSSMCMCIIPGCVDFIIDIRCSTDDMVESLPMAVFSAFDDIIEQEDNRTAYEITKAWGLPEARFHENCIDAVRKAARDDVPESDIMEMKSRAGHDSAWTAKSFQRVWCLYHQGMDFLTIQLSTQAQNIVHWVRKFF